VTEAARAEIARAAIALFAGPDAPLLRRCQGPGCILFYVRRHPRQEWCSEGCGTRARVSRHYYRHRDD
jgi:predicted RNA-binding Zn ribbon-like protein